MRTFAREPDDPRLLFSGVPGKDKNGRTYTLQLACVDPVTNLTGTKSATVTVPHDQGNR